MCWVIFKVKITSASLHFTVAVSSYFGELTVSGDTHNHTSAFFVVFIRNLSILHVYVAFASCIYNLPARFEREKP